MNAGSPLRLRRCCSTLRGRRERRCACRRGVRRAGIAAPVNPTLASDGVSVEECGVRVEVLNTGTELLLGHVINKHVGTFAEALFPLGLRIQRQVTVPDGDAIRQALSETFGRADIVLVTGGLGPTTDDLTRDITADLLGLRLEHDEEVMRHITARFARRNLPMTSRVGLQALRPPEATVLHNAYGTAPGLHIPPIALPGSG